MKFNPHRTIELLERTPAAFSALLSGLSSEWTGTNEGGASWSAFDVLGHLVHCERTDWFRRAELILSEQADKKFAPVDRSAQFSASEGKTIEQLLGEFSRLRITNIEKLKQLGLQESQLARTGIHPVFGTVTLEQLLAAWLVHDLDHLAQVSRVLAHQYRQEVGPWIEYLRILNQQKSN